MKVELWKDIFEYEGYYQASDWGRIRSLDRLVAQQYGGTQRAKGRILSPGRKSSGHRFVQLWSQGTPEAHYVHRLVLETFIGSCPDGMECCHNDGNPANNRLENLRWDTSKNNCADMVRHGTSPRGENQGGSILTALEVVEIVKRVGQGEYQKDIADEFGVGNTTISAIVRGHTWSHITDIVRDHRSSRPSLTVSEVLEIVERVEQGEYQKDIADEFGLSGAAISRILTGETWSHLTRITHKKNIVRQRLVPSEVLEILVKLGQGADRKDIATTFGVCQNTISRIVTGRNWSHITGINRREPIICQ